MERGYRSSIAGSRLVWLIPSAGDLIFIGIFGVLAFTPLSVRLLGDAGIGWHIRTGQIILATHAVPHVDPFSATSSGMSGHPWFAWEWLYDLVVGWLESVAGLNGVVLFTALVISFTFSWTFRLLLERETDVLTALILLLLSASAAMIHFLARPHVVSWLFTIAWFLALDESERNRKRTFLLGWLPLLMLVWVNVHGGFLLGFALLAIYWASAAWAWCRLEFFSTDFGSRTDFGSKEGQFNRVLQKIEMSRRVRNLSLAGILSAAATLVNPYGFRLHIHIYQYLSNRFLMDHIDEFQSPNFHFVAQKCFAALLLLTLIALAVKPRQSSENNLSRILVILFAAYAGLYASRNIPTSSLLLTLIIGPWLSGAFERIANRRGAIPLSSFKQFLQRMHAIELSLKGHLWPIGVLLITCWAAAHNGKLGDKRLMNDHFDAKRFPAAAVNYIKEHDSPGPILSIDSWGGYLIYRFYPDKRVVIDDRHDFYGEQFLKSYLKMVRVEPGWQDFLREHNADYVLVPKGSALANVLAESGSWRSIYHDEVAEVFEPNSTVRN
jgi:hypothetical protein